MRITMKLLRQQRITKDNTDSEGQWMSVKDYKGQRRTKEYLELAWLIFIISLIFSDWFKQNIDQKSGALKYLKCMIKKIKALRYFKRVVLKNRISEVEIGLFTKPISEILDKKNFHNTEIPYAPELVSANYHRFSNWVFSPFISAGEI